MASVAPVKKSCAVNPLKSSTPLGAALAFLGIEGAVPLFHGSQGCTSFAMVLAVRHFKEAIPLQTTAMNEAATVLGGGDNLEEALINLQQRMKPRFIGVASTALVETRGEDFQGELNIILRKRPELAQTAVVFASTPDFEGALEDGWSRATAATIDVLVEPQAAPADASVETRGSAREPNRAINVLPGVHQTPADIEELRAIIESFGLEPTFLPDISSSLDGHVPDEYIGTSLGGTALADIRAMGRHLHTIAIGEHMRPAAEALSKRTSVPHTVFPNPTGLRAVDDFISLLSVLSGRSAPAPLRRQRSQLVDAMLDGHFHFSGKKVAIASDPDLLYALSTLFRGLGAEIVCAVASTKNSPVLTQVPCEQVIIGDLTDLEENAAAKGAELLVTHSHGRMGAERLGVPLFRVGFPIFDRLGVQHRCSVGYRGTRQLIYEIANLFLAQLHPHGPADFAGVLPPEPIVEETSHDHA
jgi:nitrogenase molybdenum-iron protein NifN